MLNNLYDTFNFIGKLSIHKIINGLKILTSYYVSRWLEQPLCRGLPVSISLEPTTHCNLRCPQCISGLRAFTRPTGIMNHDLYAKVLQQNKRNLVYLLFYFQGEPYLHSGFLNMVKKAHQAGIYTATSTNGHYLTANAEATVQSGLDRLIISMDGIDQHSYQQYRIGGDFQKVLDGVEALVKAKKKFNSCKPYIILQFIVMKHNEHQIGELRQMARELGVDKLQLKTVQVYDDAGEALVPENEKYARYDKKNGKLSIRNKLLNHCWKMWHSCVITWDGQIVPCCFDKDADHPMGDLKKEPMQEIWQNTTYQQFRQSLFNSRTEITMCSNCSEGTKVFG